MKMERISTNTMVADVKTGDLIFGEDMQLNITSDHSGTSISIGWVALGRQFSVKIPERLEVVK